MPEDQYMDRPEELQRLYDPHGDSEAVRAIQNEIQPEAFHRNYSWGVVKQNLYSVLLTLMIIGPIAYLTNPAIPKPSWAIPVVAMGMVLCGVLWYLVMYLPAKLAGKHFYDASMILMGGEPKCGLERLKAYHAVAVPQDAVEVEAINWQQLRTYLQALKVLHGNAIKRQREVFRRYGVKVPSQLPERASTTDPVQSIFTQNPGLTGYLLRLRESKLLLLGVLLVIIGPVLGVMVTIFPWMLILSVFAPVSLLAGVLLLFLAFILALRTPKQEVKTND